MAAEHRKPGWKSAVPHEMRLPLLLGGGLLTVVLLLAGGLINVLVVILGCGLLVLLARTVGDWLADVVGPAGRSIVVGLVLFAIGWQFLSSESRRAATASFLGLDAYWDIDGIPLSGVDIPPSSAAPPAQPGSASAPRGTGTARASPSQPKSANVPAASTEPGSSTSRVRMNVMARSESTGARLEARLSGAEEIQGVVEFLLDGRRVATASVTREATAVAYIPNLSPGRYRVEARFRGRGDFGETSSRMTFQRN